MKIIYILAAVILVAAAFLAFNSFIYNEKQAKDTAGMNDAEIESEVSSAGAVEVAPISHATMVLTIGGQVVYVDPTGGAEAFLGQPAADVVLLTDIHGDHYSTSTLTAVLDASTILIVPQAVKDILPEAMATRATVVQNGESVTVMGVAFTAVPMYNVPETEDSRHAKGRGNGYIVETGDTRVYIAGDTGPTPEMKALTNIDMAFVPMNLPYTMSVEEAAEAVLAFAPAKVYPYHYRQPDGFADVEKFKSLVNAGNPAIEVVLLKWYE